MNNTLETILSGQIAKFQKEINELKERQQIQFDSFQMNIDELEGQKMEIINAANIANINVQIEPTIDPVVETGTNEEVTP